MKRVKVLFYGFFLAKDADVYVEMFRLSFYFIFFCLSNLVNLRQIRFLRLYNRLENPNLIAINLKRG